jgi:hypothetical protein
MSGYNAVLNTTAGYRHDTIRALIEGRTLQAQTDVKKPSDFGDELVDILASRDFDDVERIMRLQYERFGQLDAMLFWSAMSYVARHNNNGKVGDELQALLQESLRHPAHIPGEDLFNNVKAFCNEYFSDYIEFCNKLIAPGVSTYTSSELCRIFDAVLEWKGYAKKGWHASLFGKTNFVSIAKSKKKILIGGSHVHLSRSRLIGLIIHEIGIHITWYEHGAEGDTDREEGVGTLVEQLMLSEFHPLRMYRFLAICLGAGVDGKQRDMRQVYDLLCDIRRLMRPEEPTQKVKEFVAKEVLRAYRSLPPTTLGLVYIRDKNYMENNSAIWSDLSGQNVTREHFIGLVAPWKENQ